MGKIRVWGLAALAVGGTISAVAVLSARGADSNSKAIEDARANVPDRPDWNWDVRPILSQNCFSCHGKGAQKAGLRLDVEKSAFAELPEDKGKHALVAGNPGKSELFKRIVSTDPDYVMPTRDSHKTLSPLDIATIERWIKQGAHYEQHWAYTAPKEVKPVATAWDKQAVNPIDRYVYARLKKEGLSPAGEADRETLINRVSLDLTGLPPTLKDVDDFVADKSPDAYEKVVDRLLSSRAYAERQANVWLDVARYADTNGGLFDRNSSIQFPYRDWVITAFQRNIPYDQFVTWQIAGDKMANPTKEQILATSFLRVGMKDSEAGSIDEEYRTNFMMERTELVGKAFLGLTVGCAKCHDHKYDVITQADYYSLGGFFNSMDESGLQPGGGAALAWPTATQAKNDAAAQQVVQAKQAAYNAALAAARSRASAQIAAVPVAARGAYLQASINADTRAYYPFDTQYKTGAKNEFASLEQDPSPLRIGAPDPNLPEPKLAGTRAEFQIGLQNKIAEEARDRAANPAKYAALDKAKADAKAAAMGAAGGKPGMMKASFTGAGPLGHKPGVGPGGHPGAGPTAGGHRPGETGARTFATTDSTIGQTTDKQPAALLDGPGANAHKFGPHAPGGDHAGLTKASLGGKPGGKPASAGRVFAPGGEAGGGGDDDDAGPRPAAGPPGAKRDPDAPRVAAGEINKALRDLADHGFFDDRISDPQRAPKRQLPIELKTEQLQWTPSALPGAAPAVLNNVKLVPGAKGQGLMLHDSVGFVADGVDNFKSTQPNTIDFYLKLRMKDYVVDTAPQGPEAIILGDGAYDLTLNKGRLEYAIARSAPHNQIKVSGVDQLPRGRWVHITATYDGNGKAAGMKLYVDGRPIATKVVQDNLTLLARGRQRGKGSLFGGSYGFSFGHGFNKPELIDGGLDELRVIDAALTPLQVAYLNNPGSVNALKPQDAQTQLIDLAASKDPAVKKAWDDLAQAREAELAIKGAVPQLLVAGDTYSPRPTYVLDRGVYNTYKGETPVRALNSVYPWSNKLPANRLGLADWLFDAKNPLTSRVYVNRMWQGHFGNGIVPTVDDFGTQGTNPTNPQLLDYLAVEFQRSGWDMKHMHKLMVMSATYRQSSVVTPDKLEKDPRNLLVDRGPRYRLPAEIIWDNALFVSGLLVDKVGGDAVFPYQPDLIWDGAAQGFVVYPYAVNPDENHRRSMYTFIKRNQAPANMIVFDMPDRKAATVLRSSSNTPLQALVLLNDPQFLEAYRKLAERSIKSSANPDRQLVTLFRLAARRYPDQHEMNAMKSYRAAEAARAASSPDEVKKLLAVGVAPTDTNLDPVQLTAMTVVAAGVMNSPDAYTLR